MAIQNELEIPKSEFPRHRVVLVIPALYRRTFVKQYMTTLLVRMGFGHAFLTLDHVSAAFGAGLSEWQPFFFKQDFPLTFLRSKLNRRSPIVVEVQSS